MTDWLEYFTWSNLLLAILWSGPVVWCVVLVIVMRSRWNRTNPLAKWGVLSLMAHNLLFAYATTVTITRGSAGMRPQPDVLVSLEDGNVREAPTTADERAQRPWQSFPQESLTRPKIRELNPSSKKIDAPKRDLKPQLSDLPRRDLPNAESTSSATSSAVDANAIAQSNAPEHTRTAAPTKTTAPQRHKSPEAIPDPQNSDPLVRRGSQGRMQRITSGDQPADLIPRKATPQTLAERPRSSPTADALAAHGEATSEGHQTLARNQASEDVAAGQADGQSNGSPRSSAAEATSTVSKTVAAPSRAIVKRRRNDSPHLPDLYKARIADNRDEIIARQGGGRDTEAAVQEALKWLSRNQSRDGRWDARLHGAGLERRIDGQNRAGAGARADTAITGLALLAFLGGGHTHLEGEYQEVVRRGIEFLLRAQDPTDGNLGGRASRFAFMYCHAMATFSLSEAYAMTNDIRLRRAVERAVGYSVRAQHAKGGWRYKPGDAGDTSQLGWQLMAIKSAQMAGVEIPLNTIPTIKRYLDRVAAGASGGLARYQPHSKVSRTMTAEALFCRQLLQINRPRADDEAAKYVLASRPGKSRANLYYWYYATLALHRHGGDSWRRWNDSLKPALLSRQSHTGQAAGSWPPDTVWGPHGGRVYSTAMAALCLEVYYRYLPLYTVAGRRDVPRRTR